MPDAVQPVRRFLTRMKASVDMNIQINQQTFSLSEPATVVDALAACGANPPFAVAINGDFVPRTQHAARALQEGDRLDVVRPVAGG
jgi:sulfur carrier protein